MEPPLAAAEATNLLHAWNGGDQQALEKLMEIVYADLHRVAHRHMLGERPSHTLQTTALINEVYLRLMGVQRVSYQDRSHFLAICARLMRRVLVDYARSRNYQKRGAAAHHTSLDEELTVGADLDPNLPALDDALRELAKVDPRKAQVVEMRFFGGLSVRESASALDVSAETVMRDWKLAKVWLLRELDRRGSDES